MTKKGKIIIFFFLFLFYFSLNFVSAQSPVTLTVNDTIVKEVNKNILGEALSPDQLFTLNDPLWHESYKNLVKPLTPGLIRISNSRNSWEINENTNYWEVFFPERGIKNDITPDGRLHFVTGGWITQRIYPGELTLGKHYRLSFDYESKGISLPGAWDFRGVFLDVFHYEGEQWWDSGNGKNLVWFEFPNGDNNGHKDLEFTYTGITNKNPLVVLLTLQLGSLVTGEAWLDNFKLVCLDCTNPSGNLVRDGDFSLFKLPPQNTDINLLKRISSKDIDRVVGFVREVGGEPLYLWAMNFESFNILKYNPNLDVNDALALENAVLNFPGMQRAIDADLDVLRYANIEKGYQIKYWEFGNEPEIWWTWMDNVLETKYPGQWKTFNYGTSPEKVFARNRLYGLLYAKLAGDAKRIDPAIKIGVSVVPREYWKESVDGFFEGLRLGRERFDSTAPNPDFFIPHPYQLAAWGQNNKCPDDQTVCIDNLLTFKDSSGPATCPGSSTTITNMNANLDYISFFEPYMNCLTNYLKLKGIVNPVIIPTEWEASGSTGVPYGRFGDEVWAADRLGKSARAGIFGQTHWNLNIEAGVLSTYGKIGSPYATKALYGKMMQNPTKLLTGTSSNEEQITVYPFRESPTAPLYLAMVNLKKENGSLPVTINLPAIYKNLSFEEYRITCDDTSPNPDPARTCLYERNVARLNGTLANTQNILDLIDKEPPVTGIIGADGSYTFAFPNHSIIFWKINIQSPDTASPNPGTVFCNYDAVNNKINFSWNWNNDTTCPGCFGPVGYCQRSNISDKGFACNNTTNPPFWWQISNKKGVIEYFSYDNQNQKGVTTDASSIDRNSFNISCNLRDGDSFNVDVDTRDALGNMVGGPPWSNVRNAQCSCPYKYTKGVNSVLNFSSFTEGLLPASCDSYIRKNVTGIWRPRTKGYALTWPTPQNLSGFLYVLCR